MTNKIGVGRVAATATAVVLTLAGCNGSGSSDAEIAQWADAYCNAADDFVSGFMVSDVHPSGSWELSYEFIQHYERTHDAAEDAARTLDAMEDVPDEARDVHDTTVEVLGNVMGIANDAIDEVSDASNDAEVQTALDRYASRMQDEADRLNDVTEDASTRVQDQLQQCLL